MVRVPYEFIEDFAFELISLAANPNSECYHHYMELYHEYLQGCGWTDLEFDQEVSERIDASWNTAADVFQKYIH